jgi:hypothetical protein
MSGWVKTEDELPPDETPVLVFFRSECIRIGEIRWENPSFEDTYESFRYWDDPQDDGQDWQWNDITHWMHLPKEPK